jgi:glycosyltransferase involved in cell wall biosynthesis
MTAVEHAPAGGRATRSTDVEHGRPRVLVVTQYFWPETFRINEVVLSLRDAGADVTVLTGKPNYPDGKVFDGFRAGGTARDSFEGVPVFRVPMMPRGVGSGVRLALNYLSFAISASVLGPWLLRGRPADVILVYGISPILQGIAAIAVKLFKRAPVVLWVQDLWPQSLEATGFVRNRRVLKLVEWVVRGIYRHSDMLLVQSQAFVEPVAALSRRDKIRYHPNPGELALTRDRAGPDLAPGILMEDCFNVVFAGNVGTAQGIDTIVEAAAQLAGHPTIRFVIVGTGSRWEWVRREIERRDLANVDLPGRFPPEAMPAILSRASALLVTLSRSDIFAMTIPSKVQAYLAAGRPIVAALDGEGARVVVDARAGVAVPSGDPAALAKAVLHMASLPADVLEAMGRRGRSYYDTHFEPELLSRRMLTLFEQAIGTHMGAGEGQ